MPKLLPMFELAGSNSRPLGWMRRVPTVSRHRQPCRSRCAAISGAIALLLGKPSSYCAPTSIQAPKSLASCRAFLSSLKGSRWRFGGNRRCMTCARSRGVGLRPQALGVGPIDRSHTRRIEGGTYLAPQLAGEVLEAMKKGSRALATGSVPSRRASGKFSSSWWKGVRRKRSPRVLRSRPGQWSTTSTR